MDKTNLAKYVTSAAVTSGMAIALPTVAPFIAPFVVPLMAGVLSEETAKALGKKGVDTIVSILGNLASSAIWESPNPLARNPENQDLLRLLANAYIESIKELDLEDSEQLKEQADEILPLVKGRLKNAVDLKKAADLIMLFPLDKNSKQGDLKYSFANRLTSADLILKIADESFSENEIFADEIEISIRRWFNEEKIIEKQRETGLTSLGLAAIEPLPEPLHSALRKQLSKSIPKKIGELIKTEGFEKSWIAFQRSHLQAILKEIGNKQNGLSDDDRELLKPLAEKLDELSKLTDLPEKLADSTSEILSHLDKSKEEIKNFVQGQAVHLHKHLTGMEERLIEEIRKRNHERNLPNTIPPSQGFVGRENYLVDLRESYHNGSRCFVLHGTGGVGKSELAKRFSEEIAGEYQAKVFVDMNGMSENPLSAKDAMFDIVVRQFGHEVAADVSPEQLKSLFVKTVQNQATLIVLDNAASKESVEALKQAKACFIITSRQSFVLTGSKSKQIVKMSEEDARELLFKNGGGEERFNGRADELAHLAGCLPMALKPLASILAEDELETATDLIERYRDKQRLLKERVDDYDNLTIEASFGLSYDKLSDEMQDRWRRLSVFPVDFDEAAIASVLVISVEEAHETQKQLRRSSLLEFNVETKRFFLHDLARVFTDDKLSYYERFQTQSHFAWYYSSILLTAHNMQSDRRENYYVNALKLIDTEWNNIAWGQKWASIFIEVDDSIAKLCMNYSNYAPDFIDLRLHPRQKIAWQEIGLKAARLLTNHRAEGSSLGNLGLVYFSLGEYEKAIDYHKQSLAIFREIGDHSGEGTNLGNLGNVYLNLGEYRKAIDYLEQSLAIARKIGDRLGEGNSLGNLGLVYLDLSEYQKAINYFEQAIAIARQNGDLSGESTILGNLGLVYYKLSEYQKAVDYHGQSLQIKRDIGDYSGAGNSLGNLGLVFNKLGDYRKAIIYHEHSLAISREIGDRSGEGNSLGNLGLVFNRLGDYGKAIDYHEQSLAISREIGDRSGEGASLVNLGSAYHRIGEYQKGVDYLMQAIGIARKIGDRSGEGKSLGNLGSAYYSLGEYQKAIDYQEQSLQIKREIGDRSGEGNSLANLGLVYKKLSEYRKAIDYLKQAIAIFREIGDRSGEGTSLANLGNAYYSLREYRKAVDYLEQAIAIKRESDDHSVESDSLGNLGSAYGSLGNYRKAIDYLEQSIVVARESNDRFVEGTSLFNLGFTYYSLGNYRMSIGYYEQALVISREIGNRSGESNTLTNLVFAHFNLNEYQKVIDYLKQSLVICRENGDRSGEANSLSNLGSAYDNLNEKEKACGLWKEALAIYEAIESPQANDLRQMLKKNC